MANAPNKFLTKGKLKIWFNYNETFSLIIYNRWFFWLLKILSNESIYFFKYFFGVPHSATLIFVIYLYVIASIAYIHPVYGAGVRTHDLLIVSRLP